MRCIAFSLALCVCAAAAGVTHASTLRLTAPKDGTTVAGAVELAAEWDDKPADASITFQLNEHHPLAEGVTEPTFSHTWHTTEIWDGPMLLRAVGRNAQGEVIARSETVAVTVDNPRGGTIRLVSPDISETLSGTVEWTVEADREPWPEEDTPEARERVKAHPMAATMFFLDGKLVGLKRGNQVRRTLEVDTATLSNGEHVLFAAAYIRPHADGLGAKPAAMVQRVVRVDNGHTLQQVRPRWNELHLRPGEEASLEPVAHYTDGAAEPWEGAFQCTSENTDVVTIDETGHVTAVAPGTTKLTWEAHGGDGEVWVTVTERATRPHLARDGGVLEEYDPQRSLFVRSMFYLSPTRVRKYPKEAEQAKQAGVNTLTGGFYPNPIHGGGEPTFEKWRNRMTRRWAQDINTVKEHGFAWLLIGDGICRTRGELYHTLTTPWAKDALQLALRTMGESGVVVGVEMVDEISAKWGAVAQPDDGRWQENDPPIPDDAFMQLTEMIREVDEAPPITWPVLGHSSPGVHRNWNEDPQLADYYSHYWVALDWRKAYPWGRSTHQTGKWMRYNMWERRAVVDIRKPELMQVGLTGPSYRKRVPGDRYTPGEDERTGTGNRTFLIPMQAILAASEGAVGVRCYSYDGMWAYLRERKPIGSWHQTGAAPTGPGADRWKAISNALNVLQDLEPALLQPSMHALDLGAWIETGAREGEHGRLFIAVSLSEMPMQRHVDLKPYLYGHPTRIRRYRVTATDVTEQQVEGETDELRFAPGEGVIWHVEAPSSR